MIKQPDIKSLRKSMERTFNKFIRLRDRNLRCISCGRGAPEQAGHFYTVAQCPQPSMRFNEKNVNGQCISCNHYNEGARQGYSRGIVKKWGAKVIDELDLIRSLPQASWSWFEYTIMIKTYKAKIKKLEDA